MTIKPNDKECSVVMLYITHFRLIQEPPISLCRALIHDNDCRRHIPWSGQISFYIAVAYSTEVLKVAFLPYLVTIQTEERGSS